MSLVWRSGLLFLALLLAVLLADVYATQVLDHQAEDAGFDKLRGARASGRRKPASCG